MPERPRRRWLSMLGYVGFFVLCSIVSLYLTFPMNALKPRVMSMLQRAVQSAGPKPGRHGSPAEVQVGDIALYRLTGVELKHVKVRLASTEPEPKPSWDIDRAAVRLQLLPLLLGRRWLSFAADLYGGSLGGEAAIVDDRLAELSLEAEGLRTESIPPLVAKVGAPLEAALDIDAKLSLDKGDKIREGTIRVQGRDAKLGPGTLKLPVPPVSLDCKLKTPMDLGTLDLQIAIADGKAKIEPAALVGKDVDVRVKASATLRSTLTSSPVTGALVFKFDEGLMEREPEVKSALELADLRIKSGKHADGSYHFRLAGSLSNLRPTPDAKASVN